MKHRTYLVPTLFIAVVAWAEEPRDASADAQTGPAPAREAPAETETGEPFFDILNNERLTGDWGGARTTMEEKGIEIGLSMTNVYQHNARRGIQTHNGHRVTGSADYELTLDTEAMGLWQGGIVYIAAESSWNDGIDEDHVGNLFGVNGDAGGDESIFVVEAWYEHTFWDGKARFRIGRIDVGVDFETNEIEHFWSLGAQYLG